MEGSPESSHANSRVKSIERLGICHCAVDGGGLSENVQLTVEALTGTLGFSFGSGAVDLPPGNGSVSWQRLTLL